MMIEEQELTATENIVEIPIQDINIIEEYLPRFQIHQETIEQYAEAILEKAHFPPITITKKENQYILVDGMHRLKAHELLGYTTIEAKIIKYTSELEILEIALQSNMTHGQKLTKEEEMHFIRKLREKGCSIKKIARLTHRSVATISKWLEIKEEKQQKIQEAISLVQQGEPIKRAAEKANISRNTLKKYLEKEKQQKQNQEEQTTENESENQIQFDQEIKNYIENIDDEALWSKTTEETFDHNQENHAELNNDKITILTNQIENMLVELCSIMNAIRDISYPTFKKYQDKIVNVIGGI